MREENEKRVFCNDMVLLCDELHGVYVHSELSERASGDLEKRGGCILYDMYEIMEWNIQDILYKT